jgi:cell division protein FtsL
MDIIAFAKSDLGIVIAWVATVLSLLLTIWSMSSRKTLTKENDDLKQTVQNLTQKINDIKVEQNGEKNNYVGKQVGTMNINM